MIGLNDYLVIGYYLAFMILLGFVFRRFSRTTSDYFRGGGSMLWWLSGPSGMMSALSAWSFTGAAGAFYEMGPLIGVIYLSNITALILVYLFSCSWFRRMRVITYVEAVRRRYGGVTEQMYVWVQVPVGILFAGIQLNAVGVFFAAVFQTEVVPTIGVISAVVIFMAMQGGAWAVVAGDFLQLLMTLLVLALAAYFALGMPELGGLSGLVAKLPAAHFDWSRLMQPEIIALWIVAYLIFAIADFNNLANGAARFIMVKDEKNARRAALSMIAGFALIAVLLPIPPLVAAAMIPDLHQQFPLLQNPQEGAFVAVCLRTMPPGIIGLLAAGIFAVAMASMDTGLNRNAGIFIRNFYLRFLRPSATERELLRASKICTLLLGAIVTGLAWSFSTSANSNLFSLTQLAGSLLGYPLAVPMVLGIFVRRAPAWAGWSTALVGVATAAIIEYGSVVPALSAALGWAPLVGREAVYLGFALRVLSVTLAACAWFFFIRRYAPPVDEDPARPLFVDLDSPLSIDPVNAAAEDGRQYRTVGWLCLAYGTGIALLCALPNRLEGRVSFLACGGVIALIGMLLRRRARSTPPAR